MLRVVALVLVVGVATAQAEPKLGVLKTPPSAAKRKAKPRCIRVVAERVRARDLKLVGEVSQGNARKILIVDKSGTGHILMRGECAGREKVPFDEWLQPHDDSRPYRLPSRA